MRRQNGKEPSADAAPGRGETLLFRIEIRPMFLYYINFL